MFSAVLYSSLGTDERPKEESTYLMFLDVLDECECKHNFCIYIANIIIIATVGNKRLPACLFSVSSWDFSLQRKPCVK